jgi:hypothetical protein
MDGNALTTAPQVVNGINIDDLFALIEGIRQDPAKSATRWHVATSWQGQRAAAVKSRASASAMRT